MPRTVGFPGGSVLKNPPAKVGDTGNTGSIPGSGRSPRGGNGNPLQFLPGKSHGQRSLVELQSMGLQRVGHDWTTNTGLNFSARMPLFAHPNAKDCTDTAYSVHTLSVLGSDRWDHRVMKIFNPSLKFTWQETHTPHQNSGLWLLKASLSWYQAASIFLPFFSFIKKKFSSLFLHHLETHKKAGYMLPLWIKKI